jgi:signal transduction histidine kinase
MARADLGDDHPVRGDLDEVMTASQRATSLVRQLLAFSRREMVNPAYLNLNEVTAGLIKMLRRLIGEHIALETDFSGDSAPIYADAGQIEQVILNLCVNARDAMPVADGGRITIRTGCAHLTPAFAAEHLWARAGDFVTLSVQDTGRGHDGLR